MADVCHLEKSKMAIYLQQFDLSARIWHSNVHWPSEPYQQLNVTFSPVKHPSPLQFGLLWELCDQMSVFTHAPTDDKLSLKGTWSLSRDLFTFCKISDNISKMVRDSLIVFIKFEQEVICALSNVYVADGLAWPLSTLNHLNFYILHCLMHLCNWQSQRL